MKKKSEGKNNFILPSLENEAKVLEKKGFFCYYYYFTNEQKFETFFFLIKLNILRVVLLTQHFHNKT